MFLRGCLDERLLLCFYGALLTSVHFPQGQETVDFLVRRRERRVATAPPEASDEILREGELNVSASAHRKAVVGSQYLSVVQNGFIGLKGWQHFGILGKICHDHSLFLRETKSG